MNERRAGTALGLVAGLLLTACASGGGSVPSSESVQSAASSTGAAKSYNLSGEYAGTVKDSEHGSGKGVMSLSESKNALGGALTIANNPATAVISWNASGLSVSGTSVVAASNRYCTFSHRGTYSTTKLTISGSYKAVYGCSGETGTYTLKQKCYFKGTSDDAIRPDNGVHPC